MTIDLSEAINALLLDLERMQNTLNEMRDNAMAALRAITPAEAQGVRLSVPWLSQLGPSAAYAPGDCGAACVAMLINSRGEARVTVDDVSKAANKPRGYGTLSFADIINAAQKFGIVLQHGNASLQTLCADIDSGKPVIALVNYQSLPLYSRYDTQYNAGHYLLIVGYDNRNMIYHDPYWLDVAKGAYKEISRADFMKAYTTVAPGNSYSAHALRMA